MKGNNLLPMTTKKKQLGQYFTPAFVADFMVALSSKGKDAKVLEPAAGEGVFIDTLLAHGFKDISGYEIDPTLETKNKKYITFESFIGANFLEKFDLVIGNPPYVRWKNMSEEQKAELAGTDEWNQYFNSLGDLLYMFILQSVELLQDGGELIFITPEYWLNTMHSRTLRNYLLQHGWLQEIYHFSETPIFDKVASSIIIFKYVKGKTKAGLTSVYKYSSKRKLAATELGDLANDEMWEKFQIHAFAKNESWILAPDAIKKALEAYEKKCQINLYDFQQPRLIPEDEVAYVRLGDIANIANGLVSGLDKAFKLPADASLNAKEKVATIKVMKAKDMESFRNISLHQYLYLNEVKLTDTSFKKDYPTFYKELAPYKDDLLKRYVYDETTNYWDWVFLRSLHVFQQDRPKIFVPCKERITNKSSLRFAYAASDVFPTQDVAAIYLNTGIREDIYYILALLNSKVTYDWVKYKGLIKGGIAEFSERPLASIPIRLIDWTKPEEVKAHDEIVNGVKTYIKTGEGRAAIDEYITKLLK